MKEAVVPETELRLHWVPVVDAAGRTRLEAVWTTAPVAAAPAHAA